MRRNLPLRLAILIPVLLFLCGLGYCQIVKHFGSGPIGASGNFVTTVSKQPYQSPATTYFQPLSVSMTSSFTQLLESNQVAAGGTSSVMNGAASGGTNQFLYAYSTTLDGTLNIYSNTYGTGASAAHVSMTAGVPYEWDYLTSGVTATLNLSNTNSMSFTAGSLANGATTSATATNITAVGLFP